MNTGLHGGLRAGLRGSGGRRGRGNVGGGGAGEAGGSRVSSRSFSDLMGSSFDRTPSQHVETPQTARSDRHEQEGTGCAEGGGDEERGGDEPGRGSRVRGREEGDGQGEVLLFEGEATRERGSGRGEQKQTVEEEDSGIFNLEDLRGFVRQESQRLRESVRGGRGAAGGMVAEAEQG